ncbi:TRAP transporter small permease [Lentibacillus lipolyticus]|nr:TRAP transporter small permease [Lentibacillus lipolyticus]
MSKMLLYVEYTILLLSLLVMSVVTFTNVLSRFIFNFSISFTEELTINLFVLLTFVGTSLGIHNKAHLGFSLIYEKFKTSKKIILSLLIGLLIMLFFAATGYYGFEIVQSQMERGQTTPSLGWPQWIFTISLPIGCLLCVIRTIEATANDILAIKRESEGGE